MTTTAPLTDKKYVIRLTKAEIREIVWALSDSSDQLEDLVDEPLDDDEKETSEETLKIVDPLHDYLQALDAVTDGTPETEPILRCEFVYSKAMQQGNDDYYRNFQKKMQMFKRYATLE